MILPSLHLVSEHYDAFTGGYWCECVPIEYIFWQREKMIAHIEMNLDLDNPEDEKTWRAAHYGRHDTKHLGMHAKTFPIPSVISDDRVPQGFSITVPSAIWDLMGGKHRRLENPADMNVATIDGTSYYLLPRHVVSQ